MLIGGVEKLLYFILGSCCGSFFCVLAERRMKQQSILKPASHCPPCQKRLSWLELIPLLSCLALRFRCQTCGEKIPKSYFIIEVLVGCLFFSLLPTDNFQQLWRLAWLSLALVFSLMDYYSYALDAFSWLLGSCGLWISGFWLGEPFYLSTLLLLLGLILVLFLGFPNKMGFGDYLLLLSWGPWLRFPQLNLLLVFASLLGLLFFALCYLCGKKCQQLPFIPFLSCGLWIILTYFP